MTPLDDSQGSNTRALAQLLRLHGRLLVQLQRIRSELQAPGTGALLRDIRKSTGMSTGFTEVTAAVEEAIRSLELSEARTRATVLGSAAGPTDGDMPELPAELQRFIGERKDMPGFTYEVIQDEVRGWVIRWKEYTERGTVRGYGQFYERPYAWLHE